jgi:hypothetical protein
MNEYVIAIPSYKRSNILKQKTLSTLEKESIARNKIFIFVVEEEFSKYNEMLPDYQIIIGKIGLVNQRQFIHEYFPEGKHILFLDDDIMEMDLLGKSLNDFIHEAFDECALQHSFIWSVYPVWNKYFRENQKYMTTCLNYLVGAFYGVINRRITMNILYDNKEDVERSILFFKKFGKTIRYNQIGFKTKYYGNVGGMGTLQERMDDIIKATDYLVDTYPDYGTRKIRKNGIHEFILKKLTPPPQPIILSSIDPSLFSYLYDLLKKKTLPYKYPGKGNSGRLGFPKYKGGVFGLCKRKLPPKVVGVSFLTKKYPEIYDELVRIGKLICPFEFTSIQLNCDLVSPKHKDKNNCGDSLLISFGDYNGANIVVNSIQYDAKYTPIIFNGSLCEHWNTDDLVGTKYSLIYFNIKL